MSTVEHAKKMARMAAEVLWSEGQPFGPKPVDRQKFEKEVEQAVLKKLVTDDTDILTESEFNQCVDRSTE